MNSLPPPVERADRDRRADMLPVTVAIPVKNDAVNLDRCLARLQRFSDVIVLDSGSTDATAAVAEKYGAQLLQFEWSGRYPKKRNWFLMNHRPRHPWIFFLDADEYVDDRFCDALASALKDSDKVGFWLAYTNYFLGRELRHGVPQRKLALFRVGAGLYERIEEEGWSRLDMEIHEHPVLDGPLGEIGVPIDHQDFKGLARFIDKHRDYATWEAQRYRALHADPGAWAGLTRRQVFKYRHVGKWWYPWFYFVFGYVARFGFLDGAAGFHYAFYKAWYFQTIRLLLREAD
ncbi:glycosyltransferase family 2 protein [Sphingomonadaceae bacterium G21617-S1]|nr:glycosyltransferase family 2 protein [Sphingomonadaceae bacterium G21617-S1]